MSPLTVTDTLSVPEALAVVRDILAQTDGDAVVLALVRERGSVVDALRVDFEAQLVREANEAVERMERSELERLRQELADTARRWREEDMQVQASWARRALRTLGVRT